MRITKTRLMRGTTINPNPPICKSKEPSFTFLTIYSCKDDSVLDQIQHYNWNWTQAHEAANGGNGTYTLGYFYEAAFKKYTDLGQRHCKTFNSIQVSQMNHPPFTMLWEAMIATPSGNLYGATRGSRYANPNDNYPAGWSINVQYAAFTSPTTAILTFTIDTPFNSYQYENQAIGLIYPGPPPPPRYKVVQSFTVPTP